MNWMAKTRPSGSTTVAARSKTGPVASGASAANVRISNGLKEFLWFLRDVPRCRVLDLGPVWQATVAFFVDKGYRISAEDLLRTWRDFLVDEEERLRTTTESVGGEKVVPSMLAGKFLEGAVQYPRESFHGVLV
jgi:hypothetical protein